MSRRAADWETREFVTRMNVERQDTEVNVKALAAEARGRWTREKVLLVVDESPPWTYTARGLGRVVLERWPYASERHPYWTIRELVHKGELVESAVPHKRRLRLARACATHARPVLPTNPASQEAF